MADYKDSAGKRLTDYPRPSVAVDTAVLAVDPDGQLCVALAGPEESPRLPGTFLHPGERLADAVARSLHEKTGLKGLAPTQLHVFDDPARDDRGWVISVAHLETIRAEHLPVGTGSAHLRPVHALPPLPFDHSEVVARAVDAIRAEYRDHPDPRRFLNEQFALRDLHAIHESVAGAPVPRDTFRRHMIPLLVETQEFTTGVVGKPARLYQRREAK